MKEYEICEVENKEYNGFLLCLTFENILSYLSQIESDPLISKLKYGTLLIDQLLTTGDGRNRYIRCPFVDGRLNVSAITIVNPNEYYRQLSLRLLRNNVDLLHDSILTEKQKDKIKKGIIF